MLAEAVNTDDFNYNIYPTIYTAVGVGVWGAKMCVAMYNVVNVYLKYNIMMNTYIIMIYIVLSWDVITDRDVTMWLTHTQLYGESYTNKNRGVKN